MSRMTRGIVVTCAFLALFLCTQRASAATYFELAPDPAGNYDLKITISPDTVSNWENCSSKSFSVGGSDKDRNGSSDTMNSAYDYGWPTTMYQPGVGNLAQLTGSATSSSTTYKAIKCGTTTYGANAVDVDPNGPFDD